MKNKEIKKEAKAIAENAIKVQSEIKKPFLIETTFSLAGATPLALKNDASGIYWVLKLNINQILDRSFYEYNVKLSVNEEPFNRRIDNCENKLEELRTEAHLPNMDDKSQMKELENTIKKIKQELATLIKTTDVIEFFCKVMSIKYNGVVTVVEINVPADTIQLLNKNRFSFGQYKIELEPIWEKD